jgi:hypothetical protein
VKGLNRWRFPQSIQTLLSAPGTIRTCGLWLRRPGEACNSDVAQTEAHDPDEVDDLALFVEHGKQSAAATQSIQVCTESGIEATFGGCGGCIRCALLGLTSAGRSLLGSNCRFGEQCSFAAELERAEGVLNG